MSEKGKTICLNMIVKNESHIILKTLNNIISKIKIDYWVIGDNGSTDNTKQIIADFFTEHKIPGELYEDEWINFGHNRTKALERAYNKSDYVFIFDADDEICGDIQIPTDHLTHDGYNMSFIGGIKYQRMCLVNNRKKWKYVGVLHEYIEFSDIGQCTVEKIEGNYYIKSNRLGARNLDPNKYLKDAKMLENGYNQAIQENDKIYNRYAFYCANSYRDAGNCESAIEWYKKTLDHDGWIQERYVSCLNLYELYTKQKDVPVGLYYLIKAYQYDKKRVEAIYELAKYYCIEKMNDVAYMYYTLIEDYYENKSLSDTMTDKLFVRINDYFFYFPYYMIIICERLKKHKIGIRMYEIIFEKKITGISQWWINNLIYNLQFFIDKVDYSTNPSFFRSCEIYLNWLHENKYTIDNELVTKFATYGLNTQILIFRTNHMNQSIDQPIELTNICKNSNKILFYVGFSNEPWNITYSKEHALGGSERAVIYLSQSLPKHFDIYIGGAVTEETVDNIHFVNLTNLKELVKNTRFHTIIVSRYIAFFEMFSDFKTYNSIIMAHDTGLLQWGCDLSSEQILNKWNKRIDKCVCLTEWHKNEFVAKYPMLKDKFAVINNGINPKLFPEIIPEYVKVKNRFVYTSRPERGLTRLLELWPDICKHFPDAELKFATYCAFPNTPEETIQYNIMSKYSNIEFVGCLAADKLYNLIASAEFWLYPNCYDETSCITGMEMLYSNVICLYYPRAGLVDTIGEYGMKVKSGNEIQSILDLTDESKQIYKETGRKYAESCSWDNRAKQWMNEIILVNKPMKIAGYNGYKFHYEMFGQLIHYCKTKIFELTIFCHLEASLDYIQLYKNIFGNSVIFKNVIEFKTEKYNFDKIILFTDDDASFDTTDEIINNKTICIDHYYEMRRPIIKTHITTRPFFLEKYGRKWALPIYPIVTKTVTRAKVCEYINIVIIGYSAKGYDARIINRLKQNVSIRSGEVIPNIMIHAICRYIDSSKFNGLNENIEVKIYKNISTFKILDILETSHFILTDSMITGSILNNDHLSKSMSGAVPLSFSTLTPLIISKQSNQYYKFKNVIEFDISSDEDILLRDIDTELLIMERQTIIESNKKVFDEHILGEIIWDFYRNGDKGIYEEFSGRGIAAKQELCCGEFAEPESVELGDVAAVAKGSNINTALIVEPRDLEKLPNIINEFFKLLGPKWKIVFYCGSGLKQKWALKIDQSIEIREMPINNLLPNEYNNMFKSKALWETLDGEYILTFQADTWIINQAPYTIDYFVSLNKSYIGGNMSYYWRELDCQNIKRSEYRNFNGGLSLRKRSDMIKIIDVFPPKKTVSFDKTNAMSFLHEHYAEDAYFTAGCYKLRLPIGDDVESSHFAGHTIFHDNVFGLHQPGKMVKQKYLEKYPFIDNPYL
jgi:glycosyltransferase involved in cell wall biosynthesis